MAEGKVKGITLEIGGDTTGLKKAISGLDREINRTQNELKAVDRLLKLDPSNTILLEQKQKLLAQTIQQTESKVQSLKAAKAKADAEMANGTEVNQEAYRMLDREIIASENALNALKTKAGQVENALSGIDEKPVEEVEDAAKKAEDALDGAGKSVSTFGDNLKAGALVEGVKGLAGAISDIADETQEYRKIMGTLDTSSAAAGYTAEQTVEAYDQLYRVLGDTQTAATTTANLQALELSQRDLNKMIELTTGAWVKYEGSIPIDGLAESINETVRAGQVTGTFADVLNWGSKEGETFGVTLKANTEANKEWNDAVKSAKKAEDFFNLALQEAGTETERANLLMQAMADQGLADMADAWFANNKDIVQAHDAQLRFTDNMAQLSERISPVIDAVKDGFLELFNLILTGLDGADFEAIAASISDIFQFLIDNKDIILSIITGIGAGLAAMKLASFITDIQGVATGVKTLADTFPLLSNAIGLLTNPIFMVTALVVGFVALIATKGDEIQEILQKVDDFLQNIFTKDWTEQFGALGNVLNSFFATLKNIWDSIKMIFDGVIDFIRGVFTGDWERAWKGVQEIFGGIWNGLVAIVKMPINAIIGLINMVIDGLNFLIGGLNKISFDVPDWVPVLGGKSLGFNIPSIPKVPYLAKGGILSSGSAIVGEAGPELLTMMGNRAMVQPLTNQTSNTTNLGGVAVYVYGAPGQDVRELATIVMDEMQAAADRKAAVW